MATKRISVVSLNNSIGRRDFLKGMGMIGLYSLGGSVLASCAPKTPSKVRNQVNWINDVEFNPFYAAGIKGFYADEGLEVEMLPGGPGIDTQLVMDAGQSELGIDGSSSALIMAVSGGSKNITFATEYQRSPAGLIYMMDNPIATPQDAIGKRIGLQDGATEAWLVVCAKNGINPETDLEIVTVGWDPSPLVDGTVDGYWGYATGQPGILRRQGHEVGVFDPWDWGFRSYGNFALVREEYLKSNKDAVVKWLRASIRGCVYANNHIEEITKYVVDTFGAETGLDLTQQLDSAAAQIPYIESDLTRQKGLFWFDKQVWQENIDTLVGEGELEADVAPDAEKLSTYEILEEVYKDGIDAVYGPALKK